MAPLVSRPGPVTFGQFVFVVFVYAFSAVVFVVFDFVVAVFVIFANSETRLRERTTDR